MAGTASLKITTSCSSATTWQLLVAFAGRSATWTSSSGLIYSIRRKKRQREGTVEPLAGTIPVTWRFVMMRLNCLLSYLKAWGLGTMLQSEAQILSKGPAWNLRARRSRGKGKQKPGVSLWTQTGRGKTFLDLVNGPGIRSFWQE